jgi:YVTN family beta-propeller protein
MNKFLATALSSVLILLPLGVGGAAQAAAENVRTIVVGDGPTGVAITHDGLTALVANSGTDSVSVISLVSETVISTITEDIGDGPIDLVISVDGTKAFVTNLLFG